MAGNTKAGIKAMLASSGYEEHVSKAVRLRATAEHVPALQNQREREAMARALGVILLDKRIRAWLAEHDPMAMEQALKAIGAL